MRTINIRFLLLFIFCSILFTGAVHGVHTLQQGRLGGAFLRQAHRAVEQGSYQDAIHHYQRYAILEPEDGVALAEMALLIAKHGNARAAFFSLERALRLDPARSDVRRKLAEVAVRIGRHSDAREHLQKHLLKANPQDGELLVLLGTCQFAVGEYAASAQTLKLAIKHAPADLEAYDLLVSLQRGKLERPVDALETLNQLVQNNPDQIGSYLTRADYYLRHRAEREVQASSGTAADASAQERISGVIQVARKDVDKALELDSGQPDALMLAARCAQEQEKFEEARDYLEQAMAVAPRDPLVYSLFADLELREKNPSAAIGWLKKGIEELPGNRDLLWNLANLIVESNQTEQAQGILDQLRLTDYPKPPINYLEARIKVSEGQWLAAMTRFEALRPALTEWPDLAKQADLHLGVCYQQLGNTDLQLTAFRRSVSVDPFWLPARLGMAQALLSLGRMDEAHQEFQYAASLPGASADVLLDLARLKILRNLRLNVAERNWEDVERILVEASKHLPDSTKIPILRAEMLVARGRADDAEKHLLAAIQEDEEQAELWTTLIALVTQQGDQAKAARILNDAREKIGDHAALRLAEARLAVLSQGDDVSKRLAELSQASSEFTASENLLLHRGIANLALSIGDFDLAESLSRQVASREPNNLSIRLLLFDLALRGDRFAAAEDTLNEIERIEGQGPLWQYGEAVRLTIEGRSGNSDALEAALKHLAQARMARPAWSRIPLLMAEIAEIRNDDAGAVRGYMQAIELGERNPRAINRVVRLLYEQRQYVEADRVIRRLEEQRSPFSGDMVRMAANISLRLDDFDRAMELAEDAAEGSTDYRDYLWLAQVLGVLGRIKEAEKKFRQAIEFSEDAPEVWVAFIGFLVRSNQLEKAESLLDEVKQSITDEKLPLTLASCYEAMRQTSSAEEHYQTALSASPDDARVLRRVANFYLSQGNSIATKPHLERMVGQAITVEPDDLRWSRRNLAMILSSQGDYASYERGISLLNQNLASDSDSMPDRRAKAILLASRGESKSRAQAIRLFEEVVKQQADPAPEDIFLLARLRITESDYLSRIQNKPGDSLVEWRKARSLMQGLLTSNSEEPRYIQVYIDALLRRDENQEAELWIERLHSLSTNPLESLALRVQTLLANNREEDAFVALTDFAESLSDEQKRDAATMGTLSRLFESGGHSLEKAGNTEAAAKYFSQAESHLGQVAQHPQDPLESAGYLARRGRHAEAIKLANEGIENANPPQIANFVAAVLRSEGSKSLPELTQLLQSALRQHSNSPILLTILADVHIWAGQYEEAETLFRQLLAENPKNVVVLNNFALMLALREKNLDESERLIQQAVELAGPQSALLDSRGVVLAMAGKSGEAIKDLQNAVAESPSASRWFHLAFALQRSGDLTAARKALDQAKQRGLNPAEFYPLDQELLRRLESSL